MPRQKYHVDLAKNCLFQSMVRQKKRWNKTNYAFWWMADGISWNFRWILFWYFRPGFKRLLSWRVPPRYPTSDTYVIPSPAVCYQKISETYRESLGLVFVKLSISISGKAIYMAKCIEVVSIHFTQNMATAAILWPMPPMPWDFRWCSAWWFPDRCQSSPFTVASFLQNRACKEPPDRRNVIPRWN